MPLTLQKLQHLPWSLEYSVDRQSLTKRKKRQTKLHAMSRREGHCDIDAHFMSLVMLGFQTRKPRIIRTYEKGVVRVYLSFRGS
jgi:hypothetical protein